MIKKLKTRFIVLAMVSLAVLLSVIVAGMNIINYRKVVSDADIRLDALEETSERLLMTPDGAPFGDRGWYDMDDIILVEYAVSVVGLELMRSLTEEADESDRREQVVHAALDAMTLSERQAAAAILDQVKPGEEALVVTVRVWEENGWIHMEVKNNGRSISREEITAVREMLQSGLSQAIASSLTCGRSTGLVIPLLPKSPKRSRSQLMLSFTQFDARDGISVSQLCTEWSPVENPCGPYP